MGQRKRRADQVHAVALVSNKLSSGSGRSVERPLRGANVRVAGSPPSLLSLFLDRHSPARGGAHRRSCARQAGPADAGGATIFRERATSRGFGEGACSGGAAPARGGGAPFLKEGATSGGFGEGAGRGPPRRRWAQSEAGSRG